VRVLARVDTVPNLDGGRRNILTEARREVAPMTEIMISISVAGQGDSGLQDMLNAEAESDRQVAHASQKFEDSTGGALASPITSEANGQSLSNGEGLVHDKVLA